MRVRQPLVHILIIGAKLGGNIMIGITLTHRVKVFGAALLRHLQTLAQAGGQHRQAIGHHFGQHPGTLTAAGHQHAEQSVFGQFGIFLIAQRQHFLAYRIADQMHLRCMFGLEPLHLLIRGSNRIYAPCKQAVDPSQHGVLFMYHAGYARARRGQQSR